MSTERWAGEGIDVTTYAGPPNPGRRRRWQITNVTNGTYVTLADEQYRFLIGAILIGNGEPAGPYCGLDPDAELDG